MNTFRFGLTTCCTFCICLAACDPVVEKDDAAAESMGETDGSASAGDASDSDDSGPGASDGGDSDGATTGATSVGTDPTWPSTTTDGPGTETGDPETTGVDTDDPQPQDDWYTVALRYEDLPEPGGGGGGTTVGSSDTTDSGGDAHAPDALVVKLSSMANSCEEPSPLLPCGEHHSLTLIIEPEQQAVGTYALFEDVDAFFTATGPIRDGDPEDCWFGGGTVGGTLEILAIDEQHIEARLSETDVFDFDADVEFGAEICQ